jgi:pathogenesis-related protein 1
MTSTRKGTSMGHRKRYAALGAATAATAATAAAMLLPAGGAAAATVPAQCPTETNATAPSQVTTAEQDQILKMHNDARSTVSAPALTWDSTIANEAQGWANLLAPVAKNGFLCHTPNLSSLSQGENIAWHPSVQSGVQGWLNEKSGYSEGATIASGASYLHYTQMVWKNTTRIGCGKATAGPNILLVCRYAPAGNYIGQKPY